MLNNEEIKKLRWSCRRGMLELDVILMSFLEDTFPSLQEAQQNTFVELLELPDPELFSALMGHHTLPQAHLSELVTLIRKNNGTL